MRDVSRWPENSALISRSLWAEIKERMPKEALQLEIQGEQFAWNIRYPGPDGTNGGTAALLGLPSKPVEVDLNNDIIFKGAKVLGINGRLMFETWYQVEAFLLAGGVHKLGKIITHVLPLAEYDRGFKLMQSGEAIKVVLKMPE